MDNDTLHMCANQCAERAWRLAYAMMGNSHDAEDVVQEAFVVAARRRDRIPVDDAWPWFATVVANVARNARRTRRKHMHDDPPDVPAPAASHDLAALVAEALAQLPEPERDAVTCTHLSGLTQAQAAAALDVPAGTLATRVRSGLARLRERLGKREADFAPAIALIFIPAPAGGFPVATRRWTSTAEAHALSPATPTKGKGMKATLLIAAVTLLALSVLLWHAVTHTGIESGTITSGTAARTGATNSTAPRGDGQTPLADTAANRADGPPADNNGGAAGTTPAGPDSAFKAPADNTVRIAFGGDANMDPMQVTSTDSGTIVGMCYESLFETDQFDLTAVRPLLASGPLEFNADFTSAMVTLRGDASFVDDPCFAGGKGRAVNADDVVYSLRRSLLLSPYRSTITEYIRGAAELTADSELPGVRSYNSRTVRFEFAKPAPDFASAIANRAFPVMAREAVEYYGDKLAAHMVGTGPFVLASRKDGVLRFVRNPAYRDVRLTGVPADSPLKPMEGRRLPLADAIELILDAYSLDALRKHGLTTVRVTGEDLKQVVSGDTLQMNDEWRGAGYSLFTQITDQVQIIDFDMRNPVTGTPGGERARAMRRAISVAFDRAAWAQQGPTHAWSPSASLVKPEWLPGAKPETPPDPDAAKARRILQDAGFLLRAEGDNWVAVDPESSEQPTLTLLLRSDKSGAVTLGEHMEAAGRRIGIRIEVKQPESWAAFVKTRMSKDGEGQMFDMGWSGGERTPEGRFGLYSTESPFSTFRHEEYDRLVATLDGFRRPGTHAYRDAEEALPRVIEILEHEVPVFVIAYLQTVWVVRADLVRPQHASTDSPGKYWGFIGQK